MNLIRLRSRCRSHRVIGGHGVAMTVWPATRTGLDPGPFWARLRFPDMIDVDLGAGIARRRTP
jgi:hypothetical protein